MYILVSGPAVVVLRTKMSFCCCYLEWIIYGRLAHLFGFLQGWQTKGDPCYCISHLLSWTLGWRKSYPCSGLLSLFCILIYLAAGDFWCFQDVDSSSASPHKMQDCWSCIVCYEVQELPPVWLKRGTTLGGVSIASRRRPGKEGIRQVFQHILNTKIAVLLYKLSVKKFKNSTEFKCQQTSITQITITASKVLQCKMWKKTW